MYSQSTKTLLDSYLIPNIFLCSCSYLQDTLGNSTGRTYQTVVVSYAEMFIALQTKLVDFIYTSSGNIGCAMAEFPGLSAIASAGLHFGPYEFWLESGVILALTSSNITQVHKICIC